MIGAYYKLIQLPDDVKICNMIRSKARLDCVLFSDLLPGGYSGLKNFVNSKGQLFFYRTACREFVNTDSRRLAEWSLTNSSQNLSSMFIEDLDCPEISYGYPNSNRLLSNGAPNPTFPYRNDGYLFVTNSDYSEIELFIIPEGKNLISSYYQLMIDGGLDEEIYLLREKATPFCKYKGFGI